MNEISENSKRIAKNTVYLYFRTFLVMFISIFTSRIVLDSLGVDNYGIYNIVGGFVSMFAVLSATLTAASQRFISFELGKPDSSDVSKVFSTSLTIHLLLAAVVFLLLETFGTWFLNTHINIPEERMTAANWVFQCSIITFCLNLICIPYNSAIIAHEKMSAFAYISIFEVSAKLGIAYLLYVVSFDVLIAYSLLMLGTAIVLRLIYGIYCKRNFEECRYHFTFDRSTLAQMLKFCGWNFIGSTASILNGQGINVITNIFFGVAINAARGIASQVDSAVNSFVQNFMQAVNPQITKSFAAKNWVYLNSLIIKSSRYGVFLYVLIGLPIFINIDYILSIWLVEVPENTGLFVRYAFVYALCQSYSVSLYITMLATGNIKKYQLIVGGLSLLALPVAYIFFKMGLPSEFGYVSIIIFSLVCLVARLVLLAEMVPGFSNVVYLKSVILRTVLVIAVAVVPVYLIYIFIPLEGFMKFFITSILSVFISLADIYMLGMDMSERAFVVSQLQKIKR